MNEYRKILKTNKGRRAIDGAGVNLVRVFGYGETKDYDPFLMLDAFDSSNPEDYIKGFPWHPHRGIETITYLIEGEIEHQDSLGNKGVIRGGDGQWMTAGSGIIHQEMPKASSRMLGAQLWLNLPAKFKMTKPAYGDIRKEDIPVLDESSAVVRVVAGNYKGIKGGFVGSFIDASYLDVQVKAGQEWVYDTNGDENLFLYIFEGSGIFDKDSSVVVEEKTAVLFTRGDKLFVKAVGDLRFVVLSGESLSESIAWGGPIVMNTKVELDQAFKDLEDNTFIK